MSLSLVVELCRQHDNETIFFEKRIIVKSAETIYNIGRTIMQNADQNTTQQIKLVIFDMDGTIFDTERLGIQKWIEAAKQLGV